MSNQPINGGKSIKNISGDEFWLDYFLKICITIKI